MIHFFNSELWHWISLGSMLLVYVFVVYLLIKTILQNRNPVTTLSWIVVLLLMPIPGLILYFFFGQKITKRWRYKYLRSKELDRMDEISKKQLETLINMEQIDDRYLAEYRKLMSMLLKDNQSFISSNNQIELFQSGEKLYQQIFDDMEAARDFIHMEYYLFEPGNITAEISRILIEKKQEGLSVSLILDGIGSRSMPDAYFKNLQDHGVEVLIFHPVRFPQLTNKINNRNHRKILVIDGKIGYTGGINMADKYLAKYGEKHFWRDTHLRIRGNSLKMLEAVFLVDRYHILRKPFEDWSRFFPEIPYSNGATVQIATNSPETGTSNILHAFFTAITTAKNNICLISPYFIPDDSLMMALKTAAAGGVKIEIILPGVKDSAFIQNSARSYVQELLKSGIQVYFYQKGFIHAKVLIVDEMFSMLGSANFDYRSFYQNFEINTLLYDEALNKKLRTQFEQDKLDSDKIDLRKWRKRPLKNKLFESLARLSAPLM
jgi:cardiolipin synthase